MRQAHGRDVGRVVVVADGENNDVDVEDVESLAVKVVEHVVEVKANKSGKGTEIGRESGQPSQPCAHQWVWIDG